MKERWRKNRWNPGENFIESLKSAPGPGEHQGEAFADGTRPGLRGEAELSLKSVEERDLLREDSLSQHLRHSNGHSNWIQFDVILKNVLKSYDRFDFKMCLRCFHFVRACGTRASTEAWAEAVWSRTTSSTSPQRISTFWISTSHRPCPLCFKDEANKT